jgi:beta-lactamase superfamily II metal-dependent hydrolase
MDFISLDVGQGNFGILRGPTEAIIFDTHVPPSGGDTEFVKRALAKAVAGLNVRGLVLTGFDADHADVRGVSWILRQYRPTWVMYPKYFKDSAEATAVFAAIRTAQSARKNSSAPLYTISVRVDDTPNLRGISDDFWFEAFSPHPQDMVTSNNSSLVVRVGRHGLDMSSFTVLVTGDTEATRWESMAKHFRARLQSDLLIVPHHGSDHGITKSALARIAPSHAHVSCGRMNQYGHPGANALGMLAAEGCQVFSTAAMGSVVTSRGFFGLKTLVWK